MLRFDVGVAGALFLALRAARIEHELGQVQIFLLAGDAIELRETHLDDLMTRPDFALARPERLVEQIGGAQGDIEQGALAGGLIVRDGGFVEMAEIV